MAQAMVDFRMLDKDLKKSFEITADPFYSESNMQRLRESIAQMESTGGTIRELPEVELDD